MSDVKPWHDAPPCIECEAPCVTPARFSPLSEDAAVNEMWCPCCGAGWTTDDIEVIAKAFFSRGAWEGHEAK